MATKLPRYANDAVHIFLGDLTSRIVAETGNPNDRYHMGKILLQSFRDAPDFLAQIDGGTGDQETNRSVLERTVRCATAMKKAGLQKGDVVVLMAPNHIDLVIPIYAALYLGVIVSTVDRSLVVQELRHAYGVSQPKMVFCQTEKVPHIQEALKELKLNAEIVTFDKGDNLRSFSEFLKSGGDVDVDNFKAEDFDPEDAIALLVATSGTTSMPKCAALTHKNLAITIPYMWGRYYNFPTPTKLALIVTSLQWMTAIMHFTQSPIFRYTRLQSSSPITPEHTYHLINTYKPTFAIFTPTLLTSLLKPGQREQCDFTCLDHVMIGGSAVPPELVKELNKISPGAEVCDTFGMTEIGNIAFHGDNVPSGACGKPIGCHQYRLVDTITLKDIFEPNVPGELWLKGPGVFKGYYKDAMATEEAFAEGRWFKTGDLFYRDEHWNFFYIERLKLLLKYKNFQISPAEIENVIRRHPGVLDVAVTGIPEPESGELPVACVVPRAGCTVNAQEIKDLVKETLSDAKQLRGGVIFLSEIPMTAATKVHRRKVKELAVTMKKL